MGEHLHVRLLGLLFILAFQSAAQQTRIPNHNQSRVILGVLEDHPGIYSCDSYFRVIRAVFHNRGSEWVPFPTECSSPNCLKSLPKSYPQAVKWTIAFDGRDLGRVEARAPADFRFYSLVGIEEITSAGTVPTVGKRLDKYAGWEFQPVYRPLVAVSQPNFKDPDGWKPAQLSLQEIDVVRERFRESFPRVSNCRNPNENKLRSWKYLNEDIKIGSAYSAKDGRSLVELGLSGWACDGPQDDGSPFIYRWYVVEPSGEARLLGTGMSLVDAGDYDGNGKSEVLFQVEGYNRGGYRLFYRNFSRSAEFLFSYH